MKRNLAKALVAGVIIIGVLIGISDIEKLLEITINIKLKWVLVAVVLSLGSFTFMSLTLSILFRIFHKGIGWRDLMKISFISLVINQVFSSGGISGYAVRAYLLSKKGVSYATSLIASIVYSVLISLALFILFIASLTYLLIKENLDRAQTAIVVGELILFASLMGITLAFLLRKGVRLAIVEGIASFVNKVSRKIRGKEAVASSSVGEFLSETNIASDTIVSRKFFFMFPWLLLVGDWILTLTVLYASFKAAGFSIEPGIMVAGFSFGFFASTLSFIPGGLGILEGSVAGFFHLLGIPFETSLVAVLIYRIAYYFVPFLSGSFAFGKLFREALRE